MPHEITQYSNSQLIILIILKPKLTITSAYDVNWTEISVSVDQNKNSQQQKHHHHTQTNKLSRDKEMRKLPAPFQGIRRRMKDQK